MGSISFTSRRPSSTGKTQMIMIIIMMMIILKIIITITTQITSIVRIIIA